MANSPAEWRSSAFEILALIGCSVTSGFFFFRYAALGNLASSAPLAVPVLVAGLPLLFRRSRYLPNIRLMSAILLVILVALGSVGVGIFYLPSALAMILAVVFARFGVDRQSLR